jgi:hypothetical protein
MNSIGQICQTDNWQQAGFCFSSYSHISTCQQEKRMDSGRKVYKCYKLGLKLPSKTLRWLRTTSYPVLHVCSFRQLNRIYVEKSVRKVLFLRVWMSSKETSKPIFLGLLHTWCLIFYNVFILFYFIRVQRLWGNSEFLFLMAVFKSCK